MYALPKCDWSPPRIACDCVCRYSPLTLKKETAFAKERGYLIRACSARTKRSRQQGCRLGPVPADVDEQACSRPRATTLKVKLCGRLSLSLGTAVVLVCDP